MLENYAMLFLILATLIFAGGLVKATLERIKLPPLAGYILIGLFLRFLDGRFDFVTHREENTLAFLGAMGVIVILFRVGLESNINGLLKQLKMAVPIWLSGVVVAAMCGFLTAKYILGISQTHSILIAIALTATSVGVPVLVWQSYNLLDTKLGNLFLDVAELDDISGVVLLGAIISLLSQDNLDLNVMTLSTFGIYIVKLAIFIFGCWLFSTFFEQKLTQRFAKSDALPNALIFTLGTAVLVAAISELAGFSFAIGSFFAGIAFSRDPEEIKIDRSFTPLYQLFQPFFFFHIGYQIDPSLFGASFLWGGSLVLAATIGKVLGHGLPAILSCSAKSSLLLGISMVPRAEITILIVDQAMQLKMVGLSEKTYAAMAWVVLFTSVFGSGVLSVLMDKWKSEIEV